MHIHCKSNNYPQADISHFRVIDQDSKQVVREAIHIRISSLILNCNNVNMHISIIFNSLLGVCRSSDGSGQAEDQDPYKIICFKTFQVIGSPEQCVCHIK